MGNTVKTELGIEVYTGKIYELADEYINYELENKDDIFDVSGFTGMILYISDNIEKPDNGDIELLDNIFKIYIRLCCKYKMLPTLECFSMLIDINPSTLSRWISGEFRANIYYDADGNHIKDFPAWKLNHRGEQYRMEPSTAHSQTVKKWKEFCKNFLVNSLENSKGTDANKIFIAKAAYGMVETAPVQMENPVQRQSLEQIQQRYNIAQNDGESAPGSAVPVLEID